MIYVTEASGACAGVEELAGGLPLTQARLVRVWLAYYARRRGEVELCLRVPCDALAADSVLGGVVSAEPRGEEAGRARHRVKLQRKRVSCA